MPMTKDQAEAMKTLEGYAILMVEVNCRSKVHDWNGCLHAEVIYQEDAQFWDPEEAFQNLAKCGWTLDQEGNWSCPGCSNEKEGV